MLFFLPALKMNDGRIRINALDQRVTGKTHNIDFLHVTTKDEEGEAKVTHFGIQGRSDHLATLTNKDDEESADESVTPPTSKKMEAVAPVEDTPVSEPELAAA
tara:strand:- start:6 stop:314 length:309 start_codon:yes stop_codon:yes gene_type:complete